MIELALESFADNTQYGDVATLNNVVERDVTDEDCENLSVEARELQEKIQRMRGG